MMNWNLLTHDEGELLDCRLHYKHSKSWVFVIGEKNQKNSKLLDPNSITIDVMWMLRRFHDDRGAENFQLMIAKEWKDFINNGSLSKNNTREVHRLIGLRW